MRLALLALLAALPACTEYRDASWARHDLDTEVVAPGVAVTFRAGWDEVEVIHDYETSCNTCDPPPGPPDVDDVLAEVHYGCTGVGCVIEDGTDHFCAQLDGTSAATAECQTPARVTAAAEGALLVSLFLVDDDGDSIRMPFPLDVVAPATLALAVCGVDYQASTCVYEDETGAVGVEFRVDGLRDGRRIAIDQDVSSPTGRVICTSRRCLLVADPSVATPIVALHPGLALNAEVSFPRELPENPRRW